LPSPARSKSRPDPAGQIDQLSLRKKGTGLLSEAARAACETLRLVPSGVLDWTFSHAYLIVLLTRRREELIGESGKEEGVKEGKVILMMDDYKRKRAVYIYEYRKIDQGSNALQSRGRQR
jgi:hypothetical protein